MISFEPASLPASSEVRGRAIGVRSDRDGWSGEVFVCVPAGQAHLLSTEGDAFLPLLAQLALTRDKDVDLAGSEVDAALLRNVRAALREHAAGHRLSRVPALANARAVRVRRRPAPGVAAFYSGGVDSQFTLVRHSQGRSAHPEAGLDRDVDVALHVLHSPRLGALAPAPRRLSAAAEAFGATLVPVWTNMMTFSRELNDRWSDMAHGAGLASILHLLGGGIGTGLIASSDTYGGLMPWGSSPITDPLYSGSGLRVVLDGSTFTRVEKTLAIADHPAALASLNLCDLKASGDYRNCGRCWKCLQTMLTLDLLGKGNNRDCPSFEWDDYRPELFTRVFFRYYELPQAEEIRDAARGVRPDIVAACEAAIRKSRWLRPLHSLESAVKLSKAGRHYRSDLVSLRDQAYRRVGILR